MSQTDPPPNHAHESTHDRSPAPGNVLGLPNDSFVVAEWRDAGGPPGPPRLIAPRHVHHNDDEAWYVLEGTLSVQVGDKDVQAPAGSAVLVPRGTPTPTGIPAPAPLATSSL